jgi:hypothetical protein
MTTLDEVAIKATWQFVLRHPAHFLAFGFGSGLARKAPGTFGTLSIGTKPLFHFTDTRNLQFIKEHGLLSLAELNRRSIQIPAAGGNQWSHDADYRMGLAEYVHLCFFNQHPMEFIAKRDGRINESVFFKINPIVLQWEGVRVTLEVANKSGTELLTLAPITFASATSKSARVGYS